jgi:hypothetical protein
LCPICCSFFLPWYMCFLHFAFQAFLLLVLLVIWLCPWELDAIPLYFHEELQYVIRVSYDAITR